VNVDKLSLLHAPFLLGLVTGGAIIYWFTGASTQAVSTGAYRAVEFIKANIRLEGVERASTADSKRVVEICTQYAQRGMFNIFLTVFFSTLAFACLEPFFFIGYLVSIAVFGLYQAIFMANAGGAWDNAKKLVEVELREKGTPLHAATVVGDTVGDPFKDTSSVSMNPVIKFTTLFGLLAVELAIELNRATSALLAILFFAVSVVFVWRSFYAMRIRSEVPVRRPPPQRSQPPRTNPARAASTRRNRDASARACADVGPARSPGPRAGRQQSDAEPREHRPELLPEHVLRRVIV
jgi:K(+)-stimulated pyrophosphate-energized sodium pump